MNTFQSISLLYIFFIWLVLLHTFEEISQGIFGLKIGRIHFSMRKYLAAASMISMVNLATLALLVLEYRSGLYCGLFTSSVVGILQLPVHTVGFIKEGGKARKLGSGFYSSIPLAITGCIQLYFIIKML